MPRYAAVDIGSNSVRMLAAEVVSGETRILAEDRQVTRLGESVFRSGRISNDALEFLCGALVKMAATYGRLGVAGVRAVATSAVRDAGNQAEFIQRVSAALGSNVEIISGAEEARLIHLGVEARWPRPKERTLIVDVGGGSAELIVSQNGQLLDSVSKPLGAVRLTEIFLKTDPATPDEVHLLQAYIDEKLLPFQRLHGTEAFQRTVVTSATAAAIVSASNGIARSKREEADHLPARLSQIRELFAVLVKSDLATRRKIVGIGPRRAEIVTAGAAVFLRVLELFELKSLYYCVAGVRDGIIADLAARGAGREGSQISREQRDVVEGMVKRYGVSMQHARHVATLAIRLFELLKPVHKLPPEAGKLLESAGYLHDIGHLVSNTGHHKHSAYLVANSDMPGFTDKERLALAALCRFHRKSLPQSRHSHFQALDTESKRWVTALAPLLRMADSLDRGHAQRVTDIGGGVRDGAAAIEVFAHEDAGLEVWTANEAGRTFRDVFGVPISFSRSKSGDF